MPIPDNDSSNCQPRSPWNKGRLIGQKRPLKPKDVWAIRVRLEIKGNRRDIALFNLAIDSKLRAYDLVKLRVNEIQTEGRLHDRATITQKKTRRPVQFELSEQTRRAVREYLKSSEGDSRQYLFASRLRAKPHLSTRQYSRLVHQWVNSRSCLVTQNSKARCGTWGLRSMMRSSCQSKLICRRRYCTTAFVCPRQISREGDLKSVDVRFGWKAAITDWRVPGAQFSRKRSSDSQRLAQS